MKVEPKITAKEIKVPKIIPPAPLLPQPQIEARTIDGLIDLYGSAENFGIAFSAEHVTLLRITKKRDAEGRPKDFIENKEVALTADDAMALRSILTSDATYNWKEGYDCVPSYGFRVKFQHKTKTINVDLCFLCRTLRVASDGNEIAENNFEFGYESLIKIIDRYFPGTIAKVEAGDGEL